MDEVAKCHYWHRFFSHQPDLNFDNPQVLKAILRIMRFWLDLLGVDGFRLDAIPYLVEREGTNNENLPETHAIIKQIRAAIDSNYPGRLLLAEANQWPEDVRQYFGDSDECHMAYHFPLMPRMYMSIAREDRYPLVDILAQTPPIPSNCQWAIFLRNHDELTLEMVTDRERDYMYQTFASDPRMRINVGIRRRLAPLMENSRPQIELISFMLMTLPGSPILYYGDEIGMGDNFFLGDRNRRAHADAVEPGSQRGVFARRSAGAVPAAGDGRGLRLSVGECRGANAQRLVAAQLDEAPDRGAHQASRVRSRRAFVSRAGQSQNTRLCARIQRRDHLVRGQPVAPAARRRASDLSRFEGLVPVEIMGGASFPPVGKLPHMLSLSGHGYFAFHLSRDATPPAWHEEKLANRPLPVLVVATGWQRILSASNRDEVHNIFINASPQHLRDEILGPYLQNRRWFAAKGKAQAAISVVPIGDWQTRAGKWRLAILQVETGVPTAQCYFLPLGIAWESKAIDPVEQFGAAGLARLRNRDQVGILYDAFSAPEFARALVEGMGADQDVTLTKGTLRLKSTSAFPPLAAAVNDDVRMPTVDQTNAGIYFGSRLYLKAYRHIHAGINPEVEIGRFLTEVSPYPHIAPVAGSAEYVPSDGSGPFAVALLQAQVANRGDAWTYTLDYLERYHRHPAPEAPTDPTAGDAAHGFYATQLELLGRRVAELHFAFARSSGDPAFDPEPVTPEEIAVWKSAVLAAAASSLQLLEQRAADATRADVEALLARKDDVVALIERLDQGATTLIKTRYHGDFHLGQVLVVENDFVIIDFEGEPGRSIAERRQKHCPLRDVAGMLRSLSYAAHTAGAAHAASQASAPDAAALMLWVREAREEFLRGYWQSSDGLPSIPAEADAREALVRLFLIEKALYELRYELANRPDWVAIPVRALLGLLDQ